MFDRVGGATTSDFGKRFVLFAVGRSFYGEVVIVELGRGRPGELHSARRHELAIEACQSYRNETGMVDCDLNVVNAASNGLE